MNEYSSKALSGHFDMNIIDNVQRIPVKWDHDARQIFGAFASLMILMKTFKQASSFCAAWRLQLVSIAVAQVILNWLVSFTLNVLL